MTTPKPSPWYSPIPNLNTHLEKGDLIGVILEKNRLSLYLVSCHNRLNLLNCEQIVQLMLSSVTTRRSVWEVLSTY